MRKDIPQEGGLSTTVLSSVRDALGRAGLLGRDLLAGLSGGLDSVSLVRLLAVVVGRGGGRLEVAHVDHGLRAGSQSDAVFCRELADELGLPFHLLELTRDDFGRGRGLQAEGRRLRRAFFERTLSCQGLDAVALGHHADDQVETVLLRLIRGTGPRGIRGMEEWTRPYVRPLLGVRRGTLEALAKERGWAFREDPSNRSVLYLRNRVRHEVLPLLKTLNPRVEEALTRLAHLSGEDDAWLSGETARSLEEVAFREPEGLRVAVVKLRSMGPALRRRLWLAASQAVGGDPAVLELQHLDTVEDLLSGGKPQRLAPVPGPVRFARCWADVWVLRADAGTTVERTIRLSAPGRAPLGVFGVEVVWGPAVPAGQSVPLPPDRPSGDLVLRPKRPGDRVEHRKVKDVLMERRVPAWRRARTLVVEDGAGILGLLGPGIAVGVSGADKNPSNQAVWLDEGGEKRWCP